MTEEVAGLNRIRVEDLARSGEIEFEFYRASGPGGQNINKVSTAARLRFDPAQSNILPARVRSRLMRLAKGRLTKEGILVIEAQRFRTQEKNRQDALRRLLELIHESWEEPPERRRTRPSAASKERRLQEKKRRGRLKRERRSGDR